MSTAQKPLTNPEADFEVETVLALHPEFDKHDSRHIEDFKAFIDEYASKRVAESMFAAACVDLYHNTREYKDAEYVIAAARVATKTILDVAEFIANNPDAPVYMANEYTISILSTKHMEIRRGKDKFSARISIEGRHQDEAMMHGSKLSRIDTSWWDDEDGGGGWRPQGFYLRDVVEPVRTPGNISTDPILTGAESIAELFKKLIERESFEGFTENRLRTISYPLWLMKSKTPDLAGPIDVIANEFGATSAWAEQCARQIGANAAGVLKRTHEQPDIEDNPGLGLAFMLGSILLHREIEMLGLTEYQVNEQVVLQCERLGIQPSAEDIDRITKLVTNDFFVKKSDQTT